MSRSPGCGKVYPPRFPGFNVDSMPECDFEIPRLSRSSHIEVRTLSAARTSKWMLIACLMLVALPSRPQTLPTTTSGTLPDSGFLWLPQLAPAGPMTIVVSLPLQRAYVFRNGIRIGVSRVSTGKTGYETPTGVFTILQKHREHYSNLYDDAPMPLMQRLTWDGVALHAGQVPDYPASHGCIRLPYAFAEHLFDATTTGMTVIVSASRDVAAIVQSEPLAARMDTPAPRTAQESGYHWEPQRSETGPVTVVVGAVEQEIVVLRNAVEIGRAPVNIAAGTWHGTRAYLLLQGSGPGTSRVVPGRPALRWLEIPLGPVSETASDPAQAIDAGLMRFDPGFAARIYDVLVPGATVLVTDEPVGTRPVSAEALLDAERPAE